MHSYQILIKDSFNKFWSHILDFQISIFFKFLKRINRNSKVAAICQALGQSWWIFARINFSSSVRNTLFGATTRTALWTSLADTWPEKIFTNWIFSNSKHFLLPTNIFEISHHCDGFTGIVLLPILMMTWLHERGKAREALCVDLSSCGRRVLRLIVLLYRVDTDTDTSKSTFCWEPRYM